MIRRAAPADIDDILRVYRAARECMRKSGNPGQWGEHYPPLDVIRADIRKEHLYVVIRGEAVHGVFAFVLGEEPTYRRIEGGGWKRGGPYGTIHRIASDGSVRGVFGECLAFCKTLSGNIRIDTHQNNGAMGHLIEKSGFARCGVIYVEDGSPRIAYQYVEGEQSAAVQRP